MVSAILAVFILQWAWVRYVTRGIRNVGPAPLLFVGNLPLVLYFGTKLEKFVEHLRNKYGNMFEFWMGWKRVIFVGDPLVVKRISIFIFLHHLKLLSLSHILTDTDSFEKMHWEKYVLGPVMEGGLVILNGEEWRNHHRTINTFFNSESYVELCKEAMEAIERVWPKNLQQPIKLQTEFRKMTSEILSKLIFGWSFHDAGILDNFVATIELLNHDLEERAKDLLKLRPFVAPFEVAKMNRVKIDGELQLRAFIKEARIQHGNKEQINNGKFNSLMDIMMEDKSFTDLDILHEVKTLFGASETTVHLMTWTIHALSQNPRVENKLLAEIKSISGENIIEEISECSYLNAVVNECLRLFPPSPALFRQATHFHPSI